MPVIESLQNLNIRTSELPKLIRINSCSKFPDSLDQSLEHSSVIKFVKCDLSYRQTYPEETGRNQAKFVWEYVLGEDS